VAAKTGSKIVVYCEGLLSYFDDDEKRKIAKTIKGIVEKYGGVWITPDPALSVESREFLKKSWPAFRQTLKKAEKMAKQKYDNHGFQSIKDTDRFFRECEFSIRKYNWPTKLNFLKTSEYSEKKISEFKSVLKKYGKVWILSLHGS
jgi:O-methyltransferase involved in polyketide biosynthesis